MSLLEKPSSPDTSDCGCGLQNHSSQYLNKYLLLVHNCQPGIFITLSQKINYIINNMVWYICFITDAAELYHEIFLSTKMPLEIEVRERGHQ